MPIYFDEVREVLLNPPNEFEATRRELLDKALRIQALSVSIGILAVVITAASTSSTSNSLTRICLFALGSASVLTAHEIYVISKNAEDIITKWEIRNIATINITKFVEQLLWGTWVVKPVAGSWVARKLNKPKP